MTGMYLAALVFSCCGIAALDWRHRLVFWAAPMRATAVMGIGVTGFVMWDVWGIAGEYFFRGDSALLVGVNLGPEFPLEELWFLTLLCYSTLALYCAAERGLRRFTPPASHDGAESL